MKKIFLTSIIIMGCVLFSCEKTITVNAPPYTPRVSIQCMLEPDSIPVVYFSRTVPYFDTILNFTDLVIRNAQIKIQSSIGTDNFKLDSVFDPIYCQYKFYYKGNTPVQLNNTYTLTIVNSSDTYTATCETNQPKTIIDSTGYTPEFSDIYGGHEGVIVYFKDISGQTNYYRYEMKRYVDSADEFAGPKLHASCLGEDSVAVDELGRSVYNDEGQSGKEIKIVIEPAYTHSLGTTGTVYVQTIDKNAYDFFDQLDRQKLAQFNPFVEPVFIKDGQFGSKAIGYFSSMVKSDPVAFAFPE
jgi:hypothetical protein